MRLRTKYILFVVVIHLIALGLTYFIFVKSRIWFIVSEVLILFSVFLSWQLYRGLLRPLKSLRDGIEAIKDRDFTVKFAATGKHEMDELIFVYNAMIDELRTERTKQEEQHFFLEKLILTSPTGIIILDYDDHIQLLNPKAIELLAIEGCAVKGKPLDTIFHPLVKELSMLPSGGSKLINLNGMETFKLQKSHFMDRGFPRYFVLIEELTAEMLAAEKKAYGKVIRMMAHEVNNTIGPVNSILQSTLLSDQKSDAITHALQVALERNNNLNIFMRNFADIVRLPEPNKRAVDLHLLLANIAKLMELKAGEKQIDFLFKLSEGPLIVQADALQMEQVFINIVKNAMEAIPARGSISFITQNAPRQLIIRDTGKGIDAAVEEQLFSLFFSTKKDGQGIGLTFTREILMNHGFDFSLKTMSPGNTEFLIRFE